MRTFGVVGAGTMGSGIAQKVALEGYSVVVVDVGDEALERGRSLVDGIFAESVERRILKPERAEQLRAALRFTTDLEELKETELVVEAVFEDREIKVNLYAQLERLLPAETVIASNTSSFPITELAKWLKHPERFIGLHYFYHPVKNRLLEIIPGAQTSPETVEAARSFCLLQGKVEVLCHDSPGFVVNRYFVPWLNEAVRLLAEGVAPLDVIEATAKRGFRLGMGPFELMNVTGVPIAKHAADGLAAYLGDFYQPDQLLADQVSVGTWELGSSEEFSQPVFDRLLGVSWAVGATLVDEGTCSPLDVDLGAQVGLRWPKGPFGVFNALKPEDRGRAIDAFHYRYPDFQLPQSLTPDNHWSLPTVVAEPAETATTLWLARPDKSNALNEQVFNELNELLDEHDQAGVLILRGKGKNFAAGADVRFFIQSMEAGRIDDIVEFTAGAQHLLRRIEDFPAKVIAVADGFALGGGAELLLAADVIVATPRALIGFPETGIGIYPGLGGGWRLAKRVGPSLAKYLIATGQMLDGKSAQQIGLVDHCLEPGQLSAGQLSALERQPAGELSPTWSGIADWFGQHTIGELLSGTFEEEWRQKTQKRLRGKAPIALKLALQLIDETAGLAIGEANALELQHLPDVFGSADALVGLKSIGKYQPEFTGA
jgi:enoyl-CoA hydratase/3-hydroxyacyl-CoA dehydrogenase